MIARNILAVASAATAAWALSASPARAVSFDFESVSPPPFTGTAVPDGYAGATWQGLVLRRSLEVQGAGFVIDGTTMALSVDASPTITFAAPVIFEGALIGNSARGASPDISYDLYLGATLAASSGPIGLNTVFLASVYTGPVDKVVFHVLGSNLMSLDNVGATAAPVPEPGHALMLLAGLGLVAGLARRRV